MGNGREKTWMCFLDIGRLTWICAYNNPIFSLKVRVRPVGVQSRDSLVRGVVRKDSYSAYALVLVSQAGKHMLSQPSKLDIIKVTSVVKTEQ